MFQRRIHLLAAAAPDRDAGQIETVDPDAVLGRIRSLQRRGIL